MSFHIYSWVLFIHIASVLGFFLVHGVSIGVVLHLRRERNPERIRGLLALSRASVGGTHVFSFLVLGTGLALGWLGDWWARLWFWASLVLFLALFGMMHVWGTGFYDRVRRGVGIETFYSWHEEGPGSPLGSEELDALLSSSRPVMLAAIGSVGLLVILWLMMFKPF